METLTYTKTYTDTPEHILFAAQFYGYKATIPDINYKPTKEDIFKRTPTPQIPNPQSAGDFMVAKVDEMVKDFMTKPIQSYIKSEAEKQAVEQAKQAAQAVLANLQ